MTDPDLSDDPDQALQPFAALIGQEFIDFIFADAPGGVAARVGKALDHYTKALKLRGVDDEMGAIRCIAAEEELVVAIFTWIRLNEDYVPTHRDFVRRYKNHPVKLAFYPVLSQFRFILSDMIEHGFGLAGFEDLVHMRAAPVIEGEKVVLRIVMGDGGKTIDINPLHVGVSREDREGDEIVEAMFEDFRKLVEDQNGLAVRDFVMERADFRNKLLYANDDGFLAMGETLDELIDKVFLPTYRDLLWVLAVLLGNTPAAKEWGLVCQFIGLYRRVLAEAEILKPTKQPPLPT